MIMGTELKAAIERMGLNPNAFAKICIKKDGKPLSQSAIVDLITKPTTQPKPETKEAVEAALRQTCPHCGQYWKKPHRRRRKNGESGTQDTSTSSSPATARQK
jgi:hypothetical protein